MTTESAPTIALSEEIHDLATQTFEERGGTVVKFDKGMPLNELAEFVVNAGAVMLGKRSNPKLNAEFLRQASTLHTIGCYCKETGVDLEAADAEGIAVFNSPEGNSDADRRQKAAEGRRGEEAGGQNAKEVGLDQPAAGLSFPKIMR